MSDGTGISWADATWNPIVGCSKASPGCAHCYAERMAKRLGAMGQEQYASVVGSDGWNGETRLVEKALDLPSRWKRPRRIFVCSMGDLFHESVPNEWIDRVFAEMAACPKHTFLVLTKRPWRMRTYLQSIADGTARERLFNHRDYQSRFHRLVMQLRKGVPLPNVQLGVSVSTQDDADARIPELLATPAALRYVSAEPLLGPIDLTVDSRNAALCCGSCLPHLDLVIVGGESGPGARPMHPDWVRSIRDQCKTAGTDFFFKQWGEWTPGENVPDDKRYKTAWVDEQDGEVNECADDWIEEDENGPLVYRVGRRKAGRFLDGRTHDDLGIKGSQS